MPGGVWEDIEPGGIFLIRKLAAFGSAAALIG